MKKKKRHWALLTDVTAWREFIIEESKPDVHSTPKAQGTRIRYKNLRFGF